MKGKAPPAELERGLPHPGGRARTEFRKHQNDCVGGRRATGPPPPRRAHSPGPLPPSPASVALGRRLPRPVEDPRQLGADAIMIDGMVRQLWRPRTPNDRPPASDVIAAARAWLG